ncbi:hypothetical protein BSL78_19479 [Apostichopus japonicus]|uniref:Uncharacterized protein n=1 Tax=Stichopus japonicus TaxID=307972 RepID=A0A2G8K6U1_STIJA|nr:hypothetical protein BSL78_19479 [Apostichopus japonicus]
MTVFITASQIRCETRFSLDNGDDKKMSLKAPEVLNAWYHVACVFDETDGSTYLYIDGTLIETKTPQPLFPEETVHYDDLRFFNRNKQPIANVRSSTIDRRYHERYEGLFLLMGQSEVTELLRRQTTGAFVHVYYIGRVSEQQYEQVVLECKGHGSDGNSLTFRWATSSDGLSFTLIDPSSDPSIYEYTAELNSYQSVSRLHIIDHPLTETIYSCEGYDPSTMATSSQMFSLTFDPEVTTWTPWMSSDEPDDNDDMETLGNVQANYPQVCSDPIDVECRTLYSKVNHSDTGQVFSKSCTTTEGLHCIGSAQTEGVCLDYEIRFLCSGVNYLWTSWYNDDTPSGSEESETLDNHKSQGHSDLCEFPLFAECRTVSGDTLWYNAANNQLTYPYICNKNGLLCTNSDNPSSCSDFKVRYACPYYADSSVNAHCAVVLDGSNYLDLGYYSLDCVTDASRCTEGTTFSFWFKPLSASSASDVYFVSSGSHVEEGKGLTFSQLSGNGNYVITVKTRYHTWQATVSNSKFPLNVWTHIHISIDPPDGFKYYIDGTFEEHITTFSTSTYNIERSDAPRNLILGGRNDDYLENGHAAISDFRVYFSALQESHITAFTSCGDADGTVSVFSLTRTTHDLDFDLNIQCRVWGTPAPTLEWLLFDDISQEGSPQVISSGVVITESNPAAGCWKISDLFIADYAYSSYANKTIICKVKNDVQHDVDSIEVEIPDACEYPLGVHSGNFRAVQFEDSVDGTLLAVPALDGNDYWVQADGSRMLTIDLGVKHTIVGIALQVHQSPSGSSYDASVTVNYMDATSTWQLLEVLNLVGIEDAATTFWFAFSTPQDTSKLRSYPSTFTTSTHLRIELSGCQIGALPPHELNLTGGYDYMSNSYTALCQTASFPSVPIVWEYSGDVPESQRITENDVEGVTTYQSSLIIGEFEPDDDNFTITCNSTYAGITLSNSIQPEYGFSGTVTLSGPTSAVSGTMVMLSCDTSGDDLYNLDWYFIPQDSSLPEPVSDGLDGRSLSDPALIIPIGGTATLSIASFDPATHDGTYICSANNGTGSDSLSLAAYVLQGNISVTANDSYYDSGSNSFVLSCDFVYDGDFLNTSWILPGMMETYGNHSDSKYQFTNIEAESLLVIKSFNFSTDDGFYTCKGYTSGSGEAEYQFEINYAFSGTITMNSSPTNILYGDTVVLTATIQGDDVFHLQWYYAEDNSGGIGNTLTETGNIDISDLATVIGNGGIATVTMTNFDPSHDGVYSIVVNNGSAIDSISLSGSYIAGNISVSGNTSYYLPASNTFVLTCDFIFDGQWLNVSWILPSTQEIFSNSSDLKYEVTSDCCSSPVTSFLSIYSFNYTMDDSSYTCKGYTNGGGEASLLHNINYGIVPARSDLMFSLFTSIDTDFILYSLLTAFSGTITMNSSPTNILYGDTVVVTATIQGDDVFHLQWYYAEDNSGGIGNTLTETGNIDISDPATVIGNGGIATVTMTNFDPSHDGVYSIVVNNGSAIDSISLSGSYIAGNISVSGNTSYYLPASNTFVLTCDFIFDGQWLNLSWILPSTQEIFSNSSDLKYEVTSDCCSSPVTSFLSIYSFNYTMDDSSYTCKGYTNGGGEASLLHNINYDFILYSLLTAFSGTITMNSSPTNILYGDTVVVTATILGDDVFHLQWYYAEDNSGGIGNTLTETGNIDISDPATVIGNGGIATVTMTNFDPSHDGVYSIVVNNGSAMDSISLSGSYIAGNISISGNTSYYLPASNTFVLTCDFIFDDVILYSLLTAFSGTITMNSSPTNILYGDTVVVTATILGDDVFHLQWYYAEDNSGGIGNTLTETEISTSVTWLLLLATVA